ncbi:IFT80 [Mytilus edulis]|uniref:IFT80 n=1 Tax=Mytilus edulis TaxID=6550 RepID=A0A8S3PY80_MYTED|nr:IFT80 [Mytilus edulis]
MNSHHTVISLLYYENKIRIFISLIKLPNKTLCVGWTTPEELYSGADDHLVLKWNLSNNETNTLVKLPDDVFPTDMHWFPKSAAGGGKKTGSDLFVLTSTDGKVFTKKINTSVRPYEEDTDLFKKKVSETVAVSKDKSKEPVKSDDPHTIRRLEWKNYEATVVSSKQVDVRNVVNDVKDKLDFRDRIIKLSFAFSHLIVATSSQCYIFNVRNFNTPMIFDLKEGNVTLILQAEKHFVLVDTAGVYVYSYDGRMVSSPRYAGMRADVLNYQTVALSNDTIAIRDKTDEKVVYVFDAQTGKNLGDGKPITHKLESLWGERKTHKLGNMIQSLAWNDSANMLAAFADSKFTVWYYPNVVFVDRDLINRTVFSKDASEFGKNPQILQYTGNHVVIRRAEGSIVSTVTSPYPSILHNYVQSSRFADAVRLCRFVKDDILWACLAAMSAYAKDLNTAEVSYAAILEAEKVQFIVNIKDIPVKEARNAEMALLCGSPQDAEAILLTAGLTFRAIMLNIQLYNWDRALELAVKHKTHVDTVLGYRQRYLERFSKKENIKRYQQYKDGIEIDWEKIESKIEYEYQKERERPTPSAQPASTGSTGSSVSRTGGPRPRVTAQT